MKTNEEWKTIYSQQKTEELERRRDALSTDFFMLGDDREDYKRRITIIGEILEDREENGQG
jgi:hypothetical protein